VKRAERQTEELMKTAQTLCSHSVRYLRYSTSSPEGLLTGAEQAT
jgi:hypothetical protein